ncbi:MAG TPA: TonB C-terminal domain-containing protein [Verrucomicrobiae bacterium]|nr:TonB C-terminal domain-containing protein [Verrucomicrobiae bacterium]
MADPRKHKRTSRLSVAISFVVHGIFIGILVFLAAREGILGKDLKKIAVTMVPKEKPPEEKPKEKPPEPKPPVESAKTDSPKVAQPESPKPHQAPATTTASVPAVAPSTAPPAAASPVFDFDGGKAVETTSDPTVLYKGYVEYVLRSRWHRPEGVHDESFVAEVEVAINRDGRLLGTSWKKNSGNTAWDDSVRKALSDTPNVGRAPPKDFPLQVLVRFDVEVPTEVPLE